MPLNLYFATTSIISVVLCVWNLQILKKLDDTVLMRFLATKVSPAILIGLVAWLLLWPLAR